MVMEYEIYEMKQKLGKEIVKNYDKLCEEQRSLQEIDGRE